MHPFQRATATLRALPHAGTAASPITLCGPRTAVVTAAGTKGEYVAHIQSSSYLTLSGFTMTQGLKGEWVAFGAGGLEGNKTWWYCVRGL